MDSCLAHTNFGSFHMILSNACWIANNEVFGNPAHMKERVVTPAHFKRAGERTPLIQKELISICSSGLI